jgi:hypothetical protein
VTEGERAGKLDILPRKGAEGAKGNSSVGLPAKHSKQTKAGITGKGQEKW